MQTRWRRRLVASVLALAGVALAALGAPALAEGPAAPKFRRGINLGDYMAYPSSEVWPIYSGPRKETTDIELRRLAALGLDFIRLPVEPGPLIERSPQDVTALERRLVDIVRRSLAAGLGVIVTGFPRHEQGKLTAAEILRSQSSPALDAYTAFLRRMAVLLAEIGDARVALALMNEPQPDCVRKDGPDWTATQQRLHAEVRRTAPRLAIVVTGGCWSHLDGLKHLEMAPYDALTLVDVHYYYPFKFTHQSATWTAPELRFLGGLSFPAKRTNKAKATAASARLFNLRRPNGKAEEFAASLRWLDHYLLENEDEATVAGHIKSISDWADAQRIDRGRVVIGEFGALRLPAEIGFKDDGSRARWLGAVRKSIETQGLGWALWSYHAGFGLLDDEAKGRFDRGMVDALGLKPVDR